jgi:hypothetical protein
MVCIIVLLTKEKEIFVCELEHFTVSYRVRRFYEKNIIYTLCSIHLKPKIADLLPLISFEIAQIEVASSAICKTIL